MILLVYHSFLWEVKGKRGKEAEERNKDEERKKLESDVKTMML